MMDLRTQLKKLQGETLMGIYPHPDDETMASGGLLQVAKRVGMKTVVVTHTHGDKGKVFVPKNGRTTSEIRKDELANACKLLSVDSLILESFPDGELRKTKSQWKRRVKQIIQKEKPALVVTYDHSGITGHPDHIVLSLELFKMLKTMRSRPELWWMTAPRKFAKLFANHEVLDMMTEPIYYLPLTWSERLRKEAREL